MARERVFAEFGITCVRPEVLVQTPRRFGKTVSVALFVVSVLVNVPGIKICIFSTGQRASSGLMGEIKKLLSIIPGGNQRVVTNTQEHLAIAESENAEGVTAGSAAAKARQNEPGVSHLYSYPGGTTSQYHHRNKHVFLYFLPPHKSTHPSIRKFMSKIHTSTHGSIVL